MEAVLGHELTHIRNGDVQLMVVAVIIAGVIGFFAELFFRMFFNASWSFGGGRSSSSSDSDRKGGGAGLIILLAVYIDMVRKNRELSGGARLPIRVGKKIPAEPVK